MQQVPSEEFVSQLKEIAGEKAVYQGERVTNLDRGFHEANLDAQLMVAPDDVSVLANVIRLCTQNEVSIVTHGGRTGLAGAASTRSGQLIVSIANLNRILNIDPLARTAVVEAGVTLAALNAALAHHGLSTGIDLAARDTSTLGGMASTNAGGIEAFRNGVMRQRVLGLEAVLPDGSIMSDLKTVRKANEGLDIKQLLIGAEGTLGTITKLSLSLDVCREPSVTLLLACPDAASALSVIRDLSQHSPGNLLCAEAMWADYVSVASAELGLDRVFGFADAGLYVIAEFADTEIDRLETTLADAIEDARLLNALVAASERERQEFWLVREDSWAIDRKYPHGLWYDVSVPPAEIDSYMSSIANRIAIVSSDIRIFAISHLLDGNIHLTISAGKPLDEVKQAIFDAVYEDVCDNGGSFSAEHGIGTEKRQALAIYADSSKLRVMKQVKQVLDPQGLFNPGKVFPD